MKFEEILELVLREINTCDQKVRINEKKSLYEIGHESTLNWVINAKKFNKIRSKQDNRININRLGQYSSRD